MEGIKRSDTKAIMAFMGNLTKPQQHSHLAVNLMPPSPSLLNLLPSDFADVSLINDGDETSNLWRDY